MSIAISATGVCKTYSAGLSRRSSVTALSNVSFCLHSGEIIAVVGPSGAGKTTLLRTIMGEIAVTRGLILRFGETSVPKGWHRMAGYAPEGGILTARITGRDLLRSSGRAHGMNGKPLEDAVVRILDAFGLAPFADTPGWRYSYGIEARLSLARAFIHQPKLVVLDNPARGLDDSGRSRLKRMLEKSRTSGAAIILASCELSDLEAIADRILVLQHGIVTAQGRPRELYPADTAFTVQVTRDPLLSPGWKFVRNGDGWYSMVSGRSQLDLLLHALTCRGITPEAIAPVRCAGQGLFAAQL